MIFNDYYNIDIYLNEENRQLEPQNFIFSIHDSIHALYSNAKLKIKDPTGYLRESLLFEEGNTFKISYSIKAFEDIILKSSYTTTHDDADKIVVQGILSGDTTISLVHEFYTKQIVENKAYNDRISSIVDKLTDYQFTKKNINDTGSKSIWYQLRSDQKTFITDVLLPNAFSNNANKTPFFCFIDCANEFNFRNYKSMIETSPVCTLTFNTIDPKKTSFYSIYDIKPFRVGSLVTKKLRNRNIVTRDKDTGSFIQKSATLKELPENMFGGYTIPLIGDLSIQTNYQYYSFTQKTNGEKEALQARIIYDEKEGFFLEKFIITTAFNPKLKSGLTVNLEIGIASKNNNEKSLYQSGKYLIEDCIHNWNGEERRGSTELIVSRKFIKAQDNLLSKKLVWWK